MAAPTDELARLWEWFGGNVAGGSTIYERICHGVAADPQVLSLVLESPPSGHLPPLLLAAVHDLVLRGDCPALGDVYDGRSTADPYDAFREACHDHRDEILATLATRRVQTNEVGRSALIGPALTWAAGLIGAPFALVDVGCSAGLNLHCDRYVLDYGPFGASGPSDAAVRCRCEVRSGTPPIGTALPEIAARIGVDLDPPDLTDPDDARWLLACTWPGTGRLERTRVAIELARTEPPTILHGDAVATLPKAFEVVGPGPVCVVTTWSVAYLGVDARATFVAGLAEQAAARPLVWLACDTPGTVVAPGIAGPRDAGGTRLPDVLTAVVFDDGPRGEILATVQTHGEWMAWRTGAGAS
jgi:hypothetical protein